MTDLLNVVLKHNYFQFADKMYHQIQGTAMGTRMAPAYANLFMADLEEKLLDQYHVKPTLWKRYIDDILIIWPDNEETLSAFVRYLNDAHPTIKFTFECSDSSIDFLDLTIYKGSRFYTEGYLDIKPFFKSTNKFQYLQFNSAHPRNTFGSLIKGELTRLLRACTDPIEYNNIKGKMFGIFKDRGYPTRLIHRALDSVPFDTRSSLLREHPPKYDTYFVLEYTPDLDVRKLRSIIAPHPLETEVPKPCVGFKRAKNLANRLVRAKLRNTTDLPKSSTVIRLYRTPNLEGRSAMCGSHGCKCCRAMSKKISIFSSHNHKCFHTAVFSNCSSCNVIYLLECSKCSKRNQYVGQTSRALSQRVAGHRAKAKSSAYHNLPLYKHFLAADHNLERDAKFSILEKTTPNRLLNRESHWITTLETVYPKGLNSRFELNPIT